MRSTAASTTMSISSVLAVVLVSALAALLADARLIQQVRRTPSANIYFNLATDTHDHFYEQLATFLKRPSTPPYYPPHVSRRYVLGPRRARFFSEPLGWIKVHLITGSAPGDRATLALANDDLYLLGIANASNQWFMLPRFSGLPNAMRLPFEQNYGDFIDGGHSNLWRVPLGKQSAIFAARIFQSYTPRTPEHYVKDAFARSIIMFCEGIRLTPIHQVFSGDRWVHQTHMFPSQCKYVVNWGKLSTLLVAWQRNGRRYGFGVGNDRVRTIAIEVRRSIGVTTAGEALDLVNFILRPYYI